MTKVKSVYVESEKMCPLFRQYPMQHQAQGAYIELDIETGEYHADYNGFGNGVPFDVYHGLRRRYRVSTRLNNNQIVKLLESLETLLQRVMDGSEVVWDGNNRVAELSEDAKDAEGEIENEAWDLQPDIFATDADEYLSHDRKETDEGVLFESKYLLTANTTDEDLKEMAGDLENEAEGNNILIVDNFKEYLEELRSELKDE